MNYFLPADLEKLEAQLRKAQTDLEQSGRDIGGSAEDGNNTWHDNASYDEALRNADLCSERVRHLQDILADSVVIELPRDTRRVQIGHIVTFQDLTTQEMRTVRVGSSMCFREGEGDVTISCATSLGQMLLGLGVGNTKSGKLKNVFKTIKVLEIKMPQ